MESFANDTKNAPVTVTKFHRGKVRELSFPDLDPSIAREIAFASLARSEAIFLTASSPAGSRISCDATPEYYCSKAVLVHYFMKGNGMGHVTSFLSEPTDPAK